MKPPDAHAPPALLSSRRAAWLAAAIIVGAAFAAYHNSFSGPFVFDDVPGIVENASLRHITSAWAPPSDRGLPVTGRPLLNLSFAVNYAVGGLVPTGYHAVNLLIHTLAALVLFAVVRRTLRQPRLPAWCGGAAWPFALFAAVIWVVHPLQTAAVTYISQRAESLMGLCYLLTLLAFIRSVESPRPVRWQALAVVACALGMAAKEVMISAPLLVLLYDRTFVAGSFCEAWRRRGRFYTALATSWLALGWLMLSTGGRAGTAGFGLGVTWRDYALKQCDAIVHYLRLALWPAPLVFDYGGAVLVQRATDVWPQAFLLAALAGVIIFALWRRPVIGFLGTWFFAILAPTSSFVPVADTMFEHRMYLPLAAVVIAAVLVLQAVAGRRGLVVGLVLAVGFGLITVERNEDYRSEFALWRDTVAKRPENVRAHYTLGTVLFALGRANEAIGEYETALQLKPGSPEAHDDLGNALVRLGRAGEAVPHYEAALQSAPQSAYAHNNLGNALTRLGRTDEARAHYEAALRARPDFADAHNNLGNLLAHEGEFAAAARHYEAALQARPDLADAQANLGNVLAQTGRLADALQHYEAALRLRPEFADAHFNFATALALLERWPEAIAHYEAGLRLQPGNATARENLARVRMMQSVANERK